MKTFAQYLTESEKTYSYRIKIVGDIDTEFMSEFKKQLSKFDPVTIKDTKTTPVLSQPSDFPEFTNQVVNIIDVDFKYPATQPQLEQVVELLGLDVNRLCVNTRSWAEGVDQELVGIQEQPDVLLGAEYPEDSKQQKELSKDYSAEGSDKAVVKNSASEASWKVAGGKTPPAATTNQLPMGTKSPMSDIKRPAKPQVGRKIKD